MSDCRFDLRPQLFDSGVLAERVGEVVLQPKAQEEWNPRLESEIVDACQSQFDLVSLRSSRPLPTKTFQLVGVLKAYEGLFSEIWKRVQPALGRYQIQGITEDCAESITSLLEFSSDTRFSNDPNLRNETVLSHKLKLLRAYRQKYPEYSLMCPIPGSEDKWAGLHVAFPDAENWHLYEIILNPHYQIGALAVALIAANLQAAGGDLAPYRSVRTKIYSSNEASQKFFTRLGLKDVGRDEYFYHLWPGCKKVI